MFRDVTTFDEQFSATYIGAHELAHQWFGNLVSCEWWTYVWLKEGFATYYSFFGMEIAHPELKPWTYFVVRGTQTAMNFDSSVNTHPVANNPETAEDVPEIYTKIPYEKGAALLRMTSGFLTKSVFQKGINKYIQDR